MSPKIFPALAPMLVLLGTWQTATAEETNFRFYYLLNATVTKGVAGVQPSAPSKPALPSEMWMSSDPVYGNWKDIKALYACSKWSPVSESVLESKTFDQMSTDCRTDQERTRQNMEREAFSGATRTSGEPVIERITLVDQQATRLYTVQISPWTDSNDPAACSSWSPSPQTVAIGKEFDQFSSNCSRKQTQTRDESYVDHLTHQTVTLEQKITERTLENQPSTQKAKGTRYTHVMSVGHYYGWGTRHYYGYFSPSYMTTYSKDVQEYAHGSLAPSQFKGYTIDHLVVNNRSVSMRLLPAHTTPQFTPVITINGVSCSLTVFDKYSAYNGTCDYDISQNVGQSIKVDLQ